MRGWVSSIIHSSMMLVSEEHRERVLISQTLSDVLRVRPCLYVKTMSLLPLVPGSYLKIQNWFKLYSILLTTILILQQKKICQSVCLSDTCSRPWSHYPVSVLKSPLSWDTVLQRSHRSAYKVCINHKYTWMVPAEPTSCKRFYSYCWQPH